MIPQSNWIALGALAILLVCQQIRIYWIQREARKREELFQIVTENAADMIALVDVKGRRLYNSPAYKRILGYSAAELGATSSFDQIHPDDRFKVLEAAREARSTGIGKKLDYRIRHKDGTWRVVESLARTIRDEKGEVVKLVIVNRDITERKRAEEQLEHSSFHDDLTGLPNRRLFLDRLQRLFARAQRNPERQYAVLFVDLDGFKVFNETMGHAAGDQVIVEMSRRLGTRLRHDDTVCRPQDESMEDTVLSRMGGDEFTILLEEVTDPSHAMRAAERILSTVAEPFLVEGREVRTSASVGIALSTPTHERPEDLLQDADVAMRRAKAMGGSRCEVFDEAMHTRAVNRLKLEADLREALEKRQFRVYYQPIVELETKQITGFEALLRWQHPEQGLISPDKFMPTVENRGLAVSTGQWVMLEACTQLQAWDSEAPTGEPVGISVNVSASQLADPAFVTSVEAILKSTGVDAARLHLEITESVAAADAKLTATVLSHLKRLGVGVVLDDFGTGISSLSGLRQFPVEALKIDRALIGGMLLDRGIFETVDLIILLAHKLKLKVIAEGIESVKQLDHLRQLNCAVGQGFFFSAPVDAKAAEELLRQRTPASHAKVAGAQ
ncbi:MAG TPA: EAL domain-containing protein [Candidatus Acidoferrum sp.]|jgi:diguanylate cyclase (GGDEF)-like protein/PAS domain S-box-containing protein|nr:EAL domain-containing protein [Candidatus Acidoferrum sp.]